MGDSNKGIEEYDDFYQIDNHFNWAVKNMYRKVKLVLVISSIGLFSACGGGGGGAALPVTQVAPNSGIPNITVNTNIAQNTYPSTYKTVASSTAVTSPCDLGSATVSYPSSWNGTQNLPTVSGAPLASGIITAVILKDILPSGSLPTSCINPSNLSEFTKTIERLKALNVNVIQIVQWQRAQINGNGTYNISEDNNGALSDAVLAQYISLAHSAGIKVMMSNAIQGFGDPAGGNDMATPIGNSVTWGLWLDAFKVHMLNRAYKFQMLGVDYWEMGCNACIYGDNGDGSVAASQQFSTSYQSILNAVSLVYTGKKYIYAVDWIHSNSAYISGLDMLTVQLWSNKNYTSSDEASMTVATMKSDYIASGAVSNLTSVIALGKPVILFAGIQSRSNALSLPGYMEETGCTNNVGSINFNTSCIQAQATPNFALQAIIIEAQLETFASLALSTGSMVGVSDYWQTDFMSAAGPTFPNIASSIRNKPAEAIVKQWFAGH